MFSLSILLVYNTLPTKAVLPPGQAFLDFKELWILYKSIALLIGLSSNSWALLVFTGVYKEVLYYDLELLM